AVARGGLAIGERGELGAAGGAQRDVKALHVKHAANINAWLNLEQRKPWVLIEFGPRSPVDHRNSFAALLPFDPARFQILDYPYDLSLDWVKTGEAAKALRCSENTIRRLVSKHEPVHGSELVRRTAGNQRSINLKLLRNLLPDE
ncbi:MAG TPA: hypothetical protein PKC18_12260, partial [Lacipirellulaceae bacterium]|nr:hypothetical protein [Lacipirellulaceae bacterium]